MEKQFFDIVEVEFGVDDSGNDIEVNTSVLTTIYATKDELGNFLHLFNEVRGNSNSEIRAREA